MELHKVAKQAAFGLALLYASTALVHAQASRVELASAAGIPFMNGGVGQSETAYMRQAGRDFDLRVEFSERKDNEFIVDAKLQVTDLGGKPVFTLADAGPIVNVNLPEGSYRVSASYRGQTESRVVDLNGKAGRDLFFHWQGTPGGSSSAALAASAGRG
jgi:hypothetical protein